MRGAAIVTFGGGTRVASRCCMDVGTRARPPAYTAACVHCARVVFRRARRLGELQRSIIESHVLICRPLAINECADDLLAHFRITETTGH